MKKYLISDHTERYTETGLSFEFLAEMTKAVEALQVMNLMISFMDMSCMKMNCT